MFSIVESSMVFGIRGYTCHEIHMFRWRPPGFLPKNVLCPYKLTTSKQKLPSDWQGVFFKLVAITRKLLF